MSRFFVLVLEVLAIANAMAVHSQLEALRVPATWQ